MPSFVSREELDAHLTPMREDISEIKSDVKTLLEGKYESAFLGGRGHAFMVVLVPTILAAVIAALIALLPYYL